MADITDRQRTMYNVARMLENIAEHTVPGTDGGESVIDYIDQARDVALRIAGVPESLFPLPETMEEALACMK